jgi:hypothetical protein
VIIVPAARGFLGGAAPWGPRTSIVPKSASGTVTFTGLTIPAGALVAIGTSDTTAASAVGTVTDSAGNVWNNTGWTDNSTGGSTIFWSRFVNPLIAGSIAVTTRSGAGVMTAGGMWATGAAAAPYDAAAFGSASATVAAPTCTSGVPSKAGELFFAMWGVVPSTRTITNDPAWTSHGVFNSTPSTYGLAVASRINSGAGALVYAPSMNTGATSRINIAAFHQ